jgi:outer membrane lipoprotein-sorting protein
MSHRIPALPVLVLAWLLVLPMEATAQGDGAKKGLEIAAEADRRDEGFVDARAEAEMILRDSSGRSSTREMQVSTLEVASDKDGDWTLVQFSEPRDIAGTILLSYSHFTGDDDQWLFLPALKRVKRISSSNKSGPFVGSEFTYEDILSQEHQRYTHKWLRDEDCGEIECFVVERVPKDGNSGYTRQLVWVDQQHYRPMRIDYYDRKNVLLKSLSYKNYRQYLGRFWRAHEMTMQNRQSGKSTVLRVRKYEFRVGLQKNDFRPGRLGAMR